MNKYLKMLLFLAAVVYAAMYHISATTFEASVKLSGATSSFVRLSVWSIDARQQRVGVLLMRPTAVGLNQEFSENKFHALDRAFINAQAPFSSLMSVNGSPFVYSACNFTGTIAYLSCTLGTAKLKTGYNELIVVMPPFAGVRGWVPLPSARSSDDLGVDATVKLNPPASAWGPTYRPGYGWLLPGVFVKLFLLLYAIFKALSVAHKSVKKRRKKCQC